MKLLQHGARICAGALIGKEIHRVEDDLGFVIVSQRGDRLIMSFGSVLEQSYLSLIKPQQLMHEYTQAMLLVLLFNKPSHVTILGLGGGSLVHCLYYHFPRMEIEIVELRQAVIDVAYEYFQLPKSPRVSVIQNEAGAFLASVDAGYTDIIFSDLYGKDGVDPLQSQIEFVQQCYKALTEDGWLVLNYHTMPKQDSAVIQRICTMFIDIFVCEVPRGNKILFCSKSSMTINRSELSKRAYELGKLVNNPTGDYFKRLRRFEC